MKIKAIGHLVKANPIQTQSNPISSKAKMNVNLYFIEDYRIKDDFAVQKNKPNSNPISEKPKMNVNLYVIEDYENKTAFRLEQSKPKQTQFQTRRRFFCLLHKRLPRRGVYPECNRREWANFCTIGSVLIFLFRYVILHFCF